MISVVLDELIEADSLEELRQKAADLAEEAWRLEQEWRIRVRENPRPPRPYGETSAEFERMAAAWAEKITAEVLRPSLIHSVTRA